MPWTGEEADVVLGLGLSANCSANGSESLQWVRASLMYPLGCGLWFVLCKSRWPEVGKFVVWCFSVSEMIALS